jgi:nitrate/nitrite-specific signal transduction histidine kinase
LTGRSTTSVVFHPELKSGCSLVSCSEFSSQSEEYQSFESEVLDKLQVGKMPAMRYQKDGQMWQLAYSKVDYGTVSYILMAVVPVQDIRAVMIAVEKRVTAAVTAQIIIYALLVVAAVFVLYIVVIFLVQSVIQPLIELREICDKILEDDLTSDVPSHPSSADMKVQ